VAELEPVSVLLVDDRQDNLVALQAILAPLGHRLVPVRSGEEALKQLLTDEFALILLDVMMPGMDGFETAARVKQREKTKDIPIIFLTALTDDVANAMRGFSTGAVDFITKPFESWMLLAKVSVFIDLYRKNRLLVRQRQLLAQRLDERLILEAQQLRRLADAALAINSAMSLTDMLQHITEAARDIIGAHHSVTHTALVDGPRTTVARSERYEDAGHGDLHLEGVLELVHRHQRPVRMTRRDVMRHPALHALGEATGEHPVHQGWLAVPLTGRFDRQVGVIQVAHKVRGDFTDADEAILVQLAQMASVAVEKAELYHREHLIAETLQRSLLPAALPRLDGLQLASRYLPGAAGSEVGGDWYDAIQLDHGRVALSVGDVVGRGVSAAAIMGQLRVAMRAYALQGLGPAAVMSGLERIMQDLSDDHLATAVFMVVDPQAMQVRLANAGHPPCLWVRPDGRSTFVEEAVGPPLNVAPEIAYTEHVLSLEHGDVLFLYTDGLIEERDESLDIGLRRLQDIVEGCTGGPEQMCDRALSKLGAADKNDDVAVLAVCIGEGPPAGAADG
jgi:serine phosphatase RsbU (regulator of sigma subunit)/DNA-binding response OmpR family regulator